MKKLIYLPLLLIMLVFLSSHDMYLKLNTYFLETFTKSTVALFNGTFEKSENVIDRDRMTDVTIVQNGSRINPTAESWYEKDSITYLDFETGETGTYVIGLSTRPRTIEMDAEAFNDYLRHDGVLDVLKKRELDGTLNTAAKELYSKHVKTILQVGEKRTEDWKTSLNYPIEFIPLQNPYEIHEGDTFAVRLYAKQTPLANQLVYLGYKAPAITHTHDGSTHTHESDESNEHNDLQQFRTNDNGIIKLPIDKAGVWYLRTILLVELADSEYTHESNWATLTFAVGEGYAHDHEEISHQEIPAYYLIIGSILLILILFYFFRSRTNEN
jgi:uncharacterized GH25 family protein